MQARRIARELALLSLSQLGRNPDKLAVQELESLVLGAVRAIASEAREAIESAAAELTRGNERLLDSDTRATNLKSSKVMVSEAIELTQTAMNRLGMALDLPEFVHLSNQKEVRAYAIDILTEIGRRRSEIDAMLEEAMVDWQLNRLPRIDRDILRIAVAEMWLLGVPNRVAINESVELAKRYSGDDAHRFINGVLRRATRAIDTKATLG